MNQKYFYAIKNNQHGPASLEQLRQLAGRGGLKRSDKLWTDGMAKWDTAGNFAEVFDGLPPDLESESQANHAAPPPLETQPPPVSLPTSRKQQSPGWMAFASFILPGLGQLICGQ